MLDPAGFPQKLTFGQIVILGALVEYGGIARRIEVQVATGYGLDMTCIHLRRLADLGLVEKPYHGTFRITECGKIALAIERGCATKRRRVIHRRPVALEPARL